MVEAGCSHKWKFEMSATLDMSIRCETCRFALSVDEDAISALVQHVQDESGQEAVLYALGSGGLFLWRDGGLTEKV